MARLLNGLGGRFRSFRLDGRIGSCRLNPYGIVGSFESESIVRNCGPGDAMNDIDIISREPLPDIFVEMSTIGVFGLGRLGSLGDCSDLSKSESIELVDMMEAIFKRLKPYN